MIIYNITINIDLSVHDKWLLWMKNKHISDVLATGLFKNARFVKVLVQEEEGATYSVQFFVDSRDKLNEYYKNHAPKLRQESLELFGDKMLAFRTELEVLDEYFHAEN
ncbi:DUF4286 family protein [Flavobacterium sp.]|jgi:hypothetical protein|uniref:DUF4286 family protein n=1 Tax=Flavobacterium sp. TaxID=239 RepID=UPI003F6A105E